MRWALQIKEYGRSKRDLVGDLKKKKERKRENKEYLCGVKAQ